MPALFNTPFWQVGFRPFFFGGGVYGAVSVMLWGAFYGGFIMPPPFFTNPILWHGHEMIFGFTMAIVAGFLLTAVANWTGSQPVRRGHLAALFLLWLLGRILLNTPALLPDGVITAINLGFIPLLAVSIAVPLLRRWNKRNFVFLLLLGLLFAFQASIFIVQTTTPLYGALFIILTMISLIGGRVIPAFTVAALRRRGGTAMQTPQPKMDGLALLSLLAVGGVLVSGSSGLWLAGAALFSAGVHLLRLRFYHTLKTAHDPLVWVLHVGYIWLVVGLLLLAGYGLGWIVSLSPVLHALTVGCIGTMTLGMMSRVTLGHTRRPLVVTPLVTIAFGLMQLAAVTRVAVPIFWPMYFTEGVLLSAGLWSVCFVIYLLKFGRYLFLPRPGTYPDKN